MVATHMGTCQVCFNVQKLPKGVLSLHGYERPGYGFIIGDCPGSHVQPYEKSCDMTKVMKERLEKHVNRLAGELKEFEEQIANGTLTQIIYKRTKGHKYVGRKEIPVTEDVIVRKGERANYILNEAHPSFDEMVDRKRNHFKRIITQGQEGIAFFSEKINNWESKPLLSLDYNIEARFLIQFKFTKETYTDYYKGVRTVAKPINVWRDYRIVKESNVEKTLDATKREYYFKAVLKDNAAVFRAVPLPEGYDFKKHGISKYQEEI